MSDEVKIPSIFIDDVKEKTLSFKCTEDCDGETLLADLYVIGDTTATSRVSSGAEVGGRKGDIIEMDLDFTGVAAGGYACKIWTEETGVIAKLIVRINE